MKVSLNYSENLHFIASARQFNDFNVDEPTSFHGTDLGPSSVEYLLIGIGGCLGTTFIYCLQKRNIKMKSVEIVVDGKLSHVGPKLLLRLTKVDVEIKFKPEENASSEDIKLCIKKFREYCIVSNSIATGLSIDVNCNEI
jgi:uncharacterized OsmC-like protein